MKILRTNPVLRIPLLYALFGLLWILFTDRILLWLVPEVEQLVRWQTIKGWLFVAVSTMLIFALQAQAQRRQQRANARQKRSENLYRLLFDNNPLPMWVYDLESLAFLATNDATVEKYGYSRAEFRRMTLRDIRPEEDVERLLDDVALATSPLYFAGEWRHRRQDGSVFPVEIISHAITFDGRAARLVIANDITERKQAESALRESQARYRRLFGQLRQVIDSVPEGVLLLNPEGQVLVANPRALEYIKLLADAGIGDTLTRLGNHSLDTLLTSPRPGTWHEIACGDQIFNLLPRPLEAGPVPQGWVVVLRDVTEERAVGEQMQQQARLAAIGQLAAGIAHDFNNIINVILLYTELIEKEEGIPESTQKQMATINEQARQAAILVEQILDFSRRALLERRTLDLHSFLEEQRTLLQRTLPKNIETTVTFEAGEAALIQADAARLQQAVMNLALNARDAMPNGGRLRFELGSVQVEPSRHAPVPGMEDGKWFRLTVADSGHGIPPEIVDHVFEPFFTTKPPGKGTGLGLAQVHGIVGQHGGYITMGSEVEKGTAFTIYLPAWLPRSGGPAQLAQTVRDRLDDSAEDKG